MVLVAVDLAALLVALNLVAESLAVLDLVAFLDTSCIFELSIGRGGFRGGNGYMDLLSSVCSTFDVGIGGGCGFGGEVLATARPQYWRLQ